MKLTSWRTTLVAVLAMLGVIAKQITHAVDGDPETAFDLDSIISSVTAAVLALGFFFARDNKVTDEASGAKAAEKAAKEEAK